MSMCRLFRLAARRALRPLRPLIAPARIPAPASAPAPALCSVLSKNYVTRVKQRESLDPLLQKLDEEVRRYGRITGKDLDDILREINANKFVTSSQSLLIIRCFGNLIPEELPEERTKYVNEIWKVLKERGVPMDISHYNALLRVYIENGYNFSVDEIINELKTKELEPNRVTYQRIMWHYCQKGDVEGASKILELMRMSDMPLTDSVLDALVLGHVRQNNLEGAFSVLTAMGTAGLSPSSLTFSILMGGYAKIGDIENVKKIMSDCENKDIYFSDKDLMLVIEEMADGGHGEHVDFMLEQMQKHLGYNRDVIHLIYRLLNKGHDKIAMKILCSMTKPLSEESIPSFQSAFFIKHLVKAKIPNENILMHCKKLHDDGLAPKAYIICAETALANKNIDLSLDLLQCMKSQNVPIRQHFFWPIFIIKSQANDKNGILTIVKSMIDDYSLMPSVESLRDFIIPHIDPGKSNRLIENLLDCGVSISPLVRGAVQYYLIKNDMKEAANIVMTYGLRTNIKAVIGAMLRAYYKTHDIDSVVKILSVSNSHEHYTQTSEQNSETIEENNEDTISEDRDIVGRVLHGIVLVSDDIPGVLQKFLDSGLGITSSWANRIQESLKDNMTNDISNLFIKLTSEDLTPVTFEISYPQYKSETYLLNLLAKFESNGEDTSGVYRQLVNLYVRSKDFGKLEELITKLKETKFVFTAGTYCQIMDMYSNLDQVENALKYRELMLQTEEDFELDNIKILRLVRLMLFNSKFDGAMELLNYHKNKVFMEGDKKIFYNNICWQMLNHLAEAGEVEKVNELFNTLKEKEYIEVNNFIVGPLVKVHYANDNINGALTAFEEVCMKYRCTPLKNELNKKLIMAEDATGLQKLTDLSTSIHGEVNSLYDLVFGFIECGRLKQARKILETPGMRARNNRINNACERYSQEGKLEYLEKFLEVTRELHHIDRTIVFQELLSAYINNDDTEKAMDLWTLLQEEDIPPPNKFLIKLADHLKAKKLAVPFVVPENVSDPDSLHLLHYQTPEFKSVVDLLNRGELESAVDVINNYQIEKKYVPTKILSFVLNAVSVKNDSKLFNKIGSELSPEQKRVLSYDNRRCVFLKDDSAINNYLDTLEKNIESADNDKLKEIDEQFPLGGIHSILAKGYYERVYTIGQKYAGRGIFSPINALWVYNIVNGNADKAKLLFDGYLQNCPMVKYRKILHYAYVNNDLQSIETVLDSIKPTHHGTEKAIAALSSVKANILINMNKMDEARNVIESALSSGIPESLFSLNTMNKLKEKVGSINVEMKSN